MTYEQIRQAIIGRMVAFTGIAQDRIFYPNAQYPAQNLDTSGMFKPPAEGLWCRVSIQYATPFMAGMADKPYTRKPGQIVIQAFARARTWTKEITELADALEAHFSYWSSGDLECIETGCVDAGEDDGFYQINVVTRFRAG